MKSIEVVRFLETRRSVRPTMFLDEGPSREELLAILRSGLRVPDHKKLAPWRLVVFEGEARARIGEVFALACEAETQPAPSAVRLKTERERFLRAPVVVGVVSTAGEHPAVPEWEQILSAGAVGLSLCLAANARGFATCWLTEWVAYSPKVHVAIGLGDHERIAGFVYIGRPSETQDDRPRPTLEDKVSYWTG